MFDPPARMNATIAAPTSPSSSDEVVYAANEADSRSRTSESSPASRAPAIAARRFGKKFETKGWSMQPNAVLSRRACAEQQIEKAVVARGSSPDFVDTR